MVIVPSLKHNKFKPVTIPRASELVKAYGLTKTGQHYSGDEFLDPGASKMDNVAQVAANAFEEGKSE